MLSYKTHESEDNSKCRLVFPGFLAIRFYWYVLGIYNDHICREFVLVHHITWFFFSYFPSLPLSPLPCPFIKDLFPFFPSFLVPLHIWTFSSYYTVLIIFFIPIYTFGFLPQRNNMVFTNVLNTFCLRVWSQDASVYLEMSQAYLPL